MTSPRNNSKFYVILLSAVLLLLIAGWFLGKKKVVPVKITIDSLGGMPITPSFSVAGQKRADIYRKLGTPVSVEQADPDSDSDTSELLKGSYIWVWFDAEGIALKAWFDFDKFRWMGGQQVVVIEYLGKKRPLSDKTTLEEVESFWGVKRVPAPTHYAANPRSDTVFLGNDMALSFFNQKLQTIDF